MRISFFDDDANTLYINSDALIPKSIRDPLRLLTPGTLEWKSANREFKKYCRKSYEYQIEMCDYTNEIKSELDKHPGCIISEFIDVQV